MLMKYRPQIPEKTDSLGLVWLVVENALMVLTAAPWCTLEAVSDCRRGSDLHVV
jgi:hypothetical protein